MKMKFLPALVLLVAASAWAEEVTEELSTSEKIDRVNRNAVRSPGEPYVVDDIAYDLENQRNADPCVSRGCMWPKSSDGYVYVPYTISSDFSSSEVTVIKRGLSSFHGFSCIRFVQRSSETAYLDIQSLNGCYSYIGRIGNAQTLSLQRFGCVYYDTVQHELLHALGFHHEQTRSDRDSHIRLLLENVESGMKHNFDKIDTLNQGTSYDYNSVMHYSKYAFSSNGKPTLEAIPDPSVQFGLATEVSQNDIIRLNRLYGCPAVTTSDPSTVTTTTTRPTTSPSSALMAEASHILFVVGFWCSVWYLHPHRVLFSA